MINDNIDNAVISLIDKMVETVDNSLVESMLNFFLITKNINKNDKKIIEILIENDKKTNFKRIKYLFILNFFICLGYTLDKINDFKIFRIFYSVFSIYIRKVLAKKYREEENKTIISLGEICLKKFNKKIKYVSLKNIETNDSVVGDNSDNYDDGDNCDDGDDGDNLLLKNIYLDSYNNIFQIYYIYSLVLKYLTEVISRLAMLLFRPLFFEKRFGTARNIFNIIFVYFYQIYTFFNICFFMYRDKSDKFIVDTQEYKIKNDIQLFFQNINIVVEKNTINKELDNILNKLLFLIKNNENFIKRFELILASKQYTKILSKYKINDTISTIIVNDSYLSLLKGYAENSLFVLSLQLSHFFKSLPITYNFIEIINAKPYHIAETILWNKNDSDKINYLFVLENLTLEYIDKNENTVKVLENVSLNFEIGKSHFIYGNSGCGKTTLLNALMKRIKISSGVIKFLGIYDDYTYFSIRKYSTYVTSESALFYKSIYYNIVYGISDNKLKEKNNEIMTEINKYMTLFGLQKFISSIKKTNVKRFSKGQTQRVAIIRLFINIIFSDLRILFLDEFTSNIDNKMEETIYTELIKLQKIYSFTIFYVSHNLYNMKYSDYNYQIDTDKHSISKK